MFPNLQHSSLKPFLYCKTGPLTLKILLSIPPSPQLQTLAIPFYFSPL